MVEPNAEGAVWSIEVRRDALDQARIATEALPQLNPDINVVLQIERFALSANNMTYASEGAALGYWSLFPSEPGWGRIPVWGDAVVRESAVPEIRAGTRLFGLMPMASFVGMSVEARGRGVREVSARRKALNPVYNRYQRVAPIAAVETREADLFFRPLLAASYALAETLRASAFHDAETLVMLSASSRTALGTAMLVRNAIPTLGLTSARNRAFVERTGLYDTVGVYGDWHLSGAAGRCVVLDFAGNAELERQIRQRIGARLVNYVRIGSTHRGQAATIAEADDFFFAPAAIEQIVAERGAAAFEAAMEETIIRFARISRPWTDYVYLDTPAVLRVTVAELASGVAAPDKILIARPNGSAPADDD